LATTPLFEQTKGSSAWVCHEVEDEAQEF